MDNEYELELRGITKRFGGTVANHNVNLSVKKGEVHALVGENGAGKSTLMNILYGMLQPDEGEIVYKGKPVSIASPRDAIALGIGMVHQHFMLSPTLTVGENIVLGHPPSKSWRWKPAELEKQIELLKSDFEIDVPLNVKVQDLTVGLMQRVEIIKTLYRGAKVIILDEPTAVLTPQETAGLFQTIRKLTQAGHTVIFISHKLREVMEISDRITTLRGGKTIGTANKCDVTSRDVAQMMIGREITGLTREKSHTGEAALLVSDLTVAGDQDTIEVNSISFEVHQGEILGVAGVEGNGQTELAEALVGMRKPLSGKIEMLGKDITREKVGKRLAGGMAHIPQDRLKEGIAAELSLTENLIVGRHKSQPLSKYGVINWKEADLVSQKLIETYDIKTSSAREHCRNLSGGNMQKVIVARELSRGPKVIVACQPTRGVDIGASEYIRQMLLNLRDEGNAVLLISADLDEVMELSDRIMVMYEGKKSGEMTSEEANEEALGRMMFGLAEEKKEVAQ